MRAAIATVWDSITTADPKAVLYPWFIDSHTGENAITDSNDIPATTKEQRQYFYGVYSLRSGGRIYAKMLISHERPWPEIAQDINGVLTEQQYRVHPCQLQESEKVKQLSWLLWSNNRMDCGQLSRELQAHFGVPFDCQYRTIRHFSEVPGRTFGQQTKTENYNELIERE